MSDPKLPLGEGNVPDKVLQELLAAFALDDQRAAEAAAANPPPDFADPSDDVVLSDATGTDAGDEQVLETEVPSDDDAATDTILVQPARTAAEAKAAKAAKPAKKVIKIGASDLPDAVYLDEEAEGRLRGTSARATEASVREGRIPILIGGDEIEGESGGIPVGSGPATMDPRVRARRIAVRRAIGRRRLRWLIIGAGVVIVVVAGLAVLGSSLFAIKSVSVSGAHRVDQGLLDAVTADLRDTPTLLVDTQEVEHRLEADPWVEDARVSTHFPHDATIELVERVPMATYAGSDGLFRIVDVEGKVVAVEQNRPIEFMLVTGGGANVDPGASAGQGVTYAAQLVEALSPSMRSRTQAVVVSEADELTLLFHNGATVVLGGPTELLEKLIRLEAVLAQPDADSYTVINVSTAEISTK